MSEDIRETNAIELIREISGGAVDQMLSAALSDVAQSVVLAEAKGEVTLKLMLEPIGQSRQVSVTHTVAFVRPKENGRGKVAENEIGKWSMYVGKGGRMTTAPESQGKLPFETEDSK